LVVVTAVGDIVRWARPHNGAAKIVYDLTDSYLALPRDLKDLGRGVGKYALRELSRPVLSYRRAVREMCSSADAVVCTTEEQRRLIQRFSPNVHVILDIYDYAIREIKTDYRAGETLNLFWEGLPYTLGDLRLLRDQLKEMSALRPVALHAMTDLRFARWARRVRTAHTKDAVGRIFDRTYLYEWNELMLSRLASGCDLGVIPLDVSSAFGCGKPENKLLLMWRMGLPTLTSATPAYTRAMEACDLQMTCATPHEWSQKLRAYGEDEQARRLAGERGREYAEREFNSARMLERWDALLDSLGLL
jgi:glycosyltransferase involved in cell wall biosynthesis